MALDIPPTPLRRRERRLRVLAVLVSGIAVVALAVATASHGPSRGTHPGAPSPPQEARAGATPLVGTAAAPARVPATGVVASTAPRRLPRDVACHQLGRPACDAVARASLAALPPDVPVVTAIDAWRSILCGDTFDCPPDRLARSVPLGSAVVSFGGQAPQAWVNVVAQSQAAEAGTTGAPVAWIVRWRR